MKRWVERIICLLVVVFSLSCSNLKGASDDSNIALVLGGGGAKAAAHIGVLKVIEEAGVSVDLVVGSSMGAVVGALYAAGYSADEIEEMWLNEDWLTLFDKDKILESNLADRSVFGVLSGGVLKEKLRQKLGNKTFDELPIKFCCTATQIENKRDISEVHLLSGDVAEAVLASMSYPLPIAGYPSVEIDGMRLVDGGMMNNLPVDVADSLGAKHIIAVDLESKQWNNRTPDKVFILRTLHDYLGGRKLRLIEDELDLGWLVDWLIENPGINKHNANRLKDGIILIHPQALSSFSILSFDKSSIRQMITEGQTETKRYHWQQLQDLNEE